QRLLGELRLLRSREGTLHPEPTTDDIDRVLDGAGAAGRELRTLPGGRSLRTLRGESEQLLRALAQPPRSLRGAVRFGFNEPRRVTELLRDRLRHGFVPTLIATEGHVEDAAGGLAADG